MTGHVKFWCGTWGIVTPDGVRRGDRKREVFVHQDVLPEGVSKLADEQEVEFALIPGCKEPKALWIKVLGKLAYMPVNSNEKRKPGNYGD